MKHKLILSIILVVLITLLFGCDKNNQIVDKVKKVNNSYEVVEENGSYYATNSNESIPIDYYSDSENNYFVTIENYAEKLDVFEQDGKQYITVDELKTFEEKYVDKYAILIDDNFSNIDESLKIPQCGIGDVAYIYTINGDVAYVDFLHPGADPPLDYTAGYVPVENLIISPTDEEYIKNSKNCHIPEGQYEVYYEEYDEYRIMDSPIFSIIENKNEDSYLISQPGGELPVWIARENIDYDFSGFKGRPWNWPN